MHFALLGPSTRTLPPGSDHLIRPRFRLLSTRSTSGPDSTDFDAIVFAVPHKEYVDINLNEWITNKRTLLFDAHNVLTKTQVAEIKENKLNYMSIGRG